MASNADRNGVQLKQLNENWTWLSLCRVHQFCY